MSGKIIFYIVLISCLTVNNSLPAQVQSKSFNLLLKTLLDDDIPKIGVPEAAQSAGKFLFLDAREKEEYNVSHLQGARFVGYKNFALTALQDVPKNTPIVVYCAIGKRSDAITEKLQKAGYANVRNLYGGIFEWVNQGHPVYNNNGRTDSVHAYGRFWGHWLERGKKVY